MIKYLLAVLSIISISQISYAQENPLNKLDFLIGEWSGTGSGFGNEESKIKSSFMYVMDGKYIEIINDSQFKPTEKKPEGEHHIDKGFISYDTERKLIIFRQFNNEGYINQYILNESISNDNILIFETEVIENFVPGGKAKWTIKKINENEIQTTFDVSFGKEYTCFGTNKLKRKDFNMNNSKPKVTGIGGIFFFSKDPDKLKDWYGENLGLEITEYGSSFEFRNANHPDEINYLQWSPFKEGNKYFEPSTKEFMINYRVQNIEQLIENLKEKGVTVLDEIETYEYGKFVHIMDIEGNKIELWEPIDKVLTEIGGKTTK